MTTVMIAPTVFTATDPDDLRLIEPPIPPRDESIWRGGAVTRMRLRRTGLLYLAVLALGALPLILKMKSGWQAAGIGLWFPGGGFIADGGWALLLFPVTLLLFAAAFFAWFGSGMILGPLLVWGGAAALAGALAEDRVWSPSPYIVAAMVVAFAIDSRRRTIRRHREDAATARARMAMRPAAEAAYAERAAPVPARKVGELDLDQLAAVRYALDRALQPIEDFNGYDQRDIFQTAALRYQINFLGYALAQVQAQYTPSFHGYLSEAQRTLIDKYMQRRIWKYWVYESIWGHFNLTDWNPAAKDNIMLTGYFVPQLALYAATTGDERYAKPGSLVFRLNDRLSWAHDVHSINQSVVNNFHASAYCLYPCEPNWIYPGCNMRGMLGLAAHDLAYGTENVRDVLAPFLKGFEEEFQTQSGKVIPLRSSITGIPLPFPGSDASYASMINAFAPARARHKWAVDAAELVTKIKEMDGLLMLDLPNDGIDFGNYRKGSLTFACASLMTTAREMGDELLAMAAQNTLEHRCGRTMAGGVASYNGSNLANATALGGLINRRDGIRDLHTRPVPVGVKTGPLLSEARYPDVLVAHALSDGRGLVLVLYGTPDGSSPKIGLSRLRPGAAYMVRDRPDLSFVADAGGSAEFSIRLSGRTELHIQPA